MPKQRSWSDNQLRQVVPECRSYRSVLLKLGLIPAGGNYVQVKYRILELGIDINHFTGQSWNKGLRYELGNRVPLDVLLVADSRVQSFKLKQRLFKAGLKEPKCELCGWNKKALDGRIPVELDHINGSRNDNRIENLRILCPNCHSLQSTHRGRNKKVSLRRMA